MRQTVRAAGPPEPIGWSSCGSTRGNGDSDVRRANIYILFTKFPGMAGYRGDLRVVIPSGGAYWTASRRGRPSRLIHVVGAKAIGVRSTDVRVQPHSYNAHQRTGFELFGGLTCVAFGDQEVHPQVHSALFERT
jgi:hypothetical protein